MLAEHPASAETLVMVEYGAEVWDQLSPYLHNAWETYETGSGEIGGALRVVTWTCAAGYGPTRWN